MGIHSVDSTFIYLLYNLFFCLLFNLRLYVRWTDVGPNQEFVICYCRCLNSFTCLEYVWCLSTISHWCDERVLIWKKNVPWIADLPIFMWISVNLLNLRGFTLLDIHCTAYRLWSTWSIKHPQFKISSQVSSKE